MNRNAYRFCNDPGDAERIGFENYTNTFQQDLSDENNQLRTLKNAITAEMQKHHAWDEWEARDIRVVSIETPLMHPFVLHARKNAKDPRYKFFRTQSDFVLMAANDDENADPPDRRHVVVMGEHKTLMEVNNPWKTMIDRKKFCQCYLNAVLFEMQTGTPVSCLLWLFHSREGVNCSYSHEL